MDHNLLKFVMVVFVALAGILGHSSGRDLRPSDHGLAYQDDSFPPVQNGDTKEMRSFFGATASSSLSSLQLPEAKNISDTWMNTQVEGRARDSGRDLVKLGLLVVSAVCGLTGVVLLAISGTVFIYRLQTRRQKAEGNSATSALTSLPQGHADN